MISKFTTQKRSSLFNVPTKLLCTIVMLVFVAKIHAQNVGIGTNTPNASAKLDIDATDRGLLIPRINIPNLNAAAPVTAPTTSLLVYNTNTTSGEGFYYWNGTQWSKLVDGIDHDWYEVGSTTAPDDINDDIFTQGNVGIGITAPTQKLDVRGGNARINNAFVGDAGFSNFWAGFSHINQATNTGYGLLTSTNGSFTLINKQNTGNGYIGFRVANVDQAVILNNGNMGIGTTTPAHKLDVQGGNADVNDGTYFIRDAPGNTYGIGYDTEGGNELTIFSDDIIDFTESDNDVSIMRINGNDGNVGIGTITPTERLQINGDTRLGVVLPTNTGTIPGYGRYLYFSGGGAGATYDSDNSDPLWIARHNLASDETELRMNIGDQNTAVTDAFVIGTTTPSGWSPAFRFECNGTAHKAGGGNWTTLSDERVKKNILPYTDGLEKLLQIEPKSFQYNGKGGYVADGRTHYGVIAQEIETIAPYTVTQIATEEFDDQRVYDGSALTYMLINAVKEQQAIIDSQNKKIKELEGTTKSLSSLNNRLDELETLLQKTAQK